MLIRWAAPGARWRASIWSRSAIRCTSFTNTGSDGVRPRISPSCSEPAGQAPLAPCPASAPADGNATPGSLVLSDCCALEARTLFSAYGLREGFLFSTLDEAAQSADPLLVLCRSRRRRRQVRSVSDQPDDWIAPLCSAAKGMTGASARGCLPAFGHRLARASGLPRRTGLHLRVPFAGCRHHPSRT